MKGVSRLWWLIIPLGMAVFVVFWYDLNTFEVKLGEEPATEVIEGRVIEVSYDRKIGAWVRYIYPVEGQFYKGRAKLKERERWCFTGATVLLEQEIENPHNCKFTGLKRPEEVVGQFRFYSPSPIGYDELELTEDIFVLRQFGKKGKLDNQSLGSWYWATPDTIHLEFFPFTSQDTTPPFHQLAWLRDSLNIQIWKNLNNQRVYKLTNAGKHI